MHLSVTVCPQTSMECNDLEFQVSRSPEVKGQGRVRSVTYEFLLVAYSNHGRISNRLVAIEVHRSAMS